MEYKKNCFTKKNFTNLRNTFYLFGGGLTEIVLEKSPSLWQLTYFNSNHPIKNKNKILEIMLRYPNFTIVHKYIK